MKVKIYFSLDTDTDRKEPLFVVPADKDMQTEDMEKKVVEKIKPYFGYTENGEYIFNGDDPLELDDIAHQICNLLKDESDFVASDEYEFFFEYSELFD